MKEFLEKKHYTKEENQQYKSDLLLYQYLLDEEKREKVLTGEGDYDIIARALLDSSLIFPCKKQFYTHKIIQCGNYYKVYDFHKRSYKNEKNIEKEKFGKEIVMKNLLKTSEEDKKEEEGRGSRSPPELKKIELKNINRSKQEMLNLVLSNESIFKTFLTLTFADVKYEDIKEANKKFDIWRTNIKSKFRDFAYVCVPEFQKKRGRKTGHYVVHYHLLTNLEINDNLGIIVPQKRFTLKQLEDMSFEKRKKCYDVKYWSYGYTSVFRVKDINIVGYMSKYMTKDIDNRLWGKRRYLASHNLKKPSTVYLDDNDLKKWVKLVSIETSMNKIYESVYSNKITGEIVTYSEYKRNEVEINV